MLSLLWEQTGDIITFAQIGEGYILTKPRKNAESGNESGDYSIMPPLLSKEEMDAMDYGNDSYHDIISTEMLENIRDGSQCHPRVNRREACYKILNRIRQRKLEWKGALKAKTSMVKGYTRYLRLL